MNLIFKMTQIEKNLKSESEFNRVFSNTSKNSGVKLLDKVTVMLDECLWCIG